MSKSKHINTIAFPSNPEIISKYLNYFNHSKVSHDTAKTSLKLFDGFLNKSFEYLEYKDFKSYHTYLNTSSKWTLVSKKTYFGFAKRFVEDLLKNYPN